MMMAEQQAPMVVTPSYRSQTHQGSLFGVKGLTPIARQKFVPCLLKTLRRHIPPVQMAHGTLRLMIDTLQGRFFLPPEKSRTENVVTFDELSPGTIKDIQIQFALDFDDDLLDVKSGLRIEQRMVEQPFLQGSKRVKILQALAFGIVGIEFRLVQICSRKIGRRQSTGLFG